MSATRYRDGCLSVFLLAGLLALAPRSDAAWAAVAGSHAGGHVGGFRGVVASVCTFREAGTSGAASLAGAPVTNVSPTGATADEVSSRTSAIYPYFDEDELDYGYDPYYSNNPYPSGYPQGGHCDVTSHSYPQYCVWKDGL